MRRIIIAFVSVFISCTSVMAVADTLYVTDRILLGVHQQAAETSPVVATIPSGTAVNVIDSSDDFDQIQLSDGTQGWVSAAYLSTKKPATAQLDAVNAQLKQAQNQVDSLNDKLKKNARDNQVLQDEVSNDKSTIQELKNKLKKQLASMPSPSQQAENEIKTLKAQVKKLASQKKVLVKENNTDSELSMRDLQGQNQQLQARIEAAIANLKGDKVPSASELASIRPSFPLWYWILLFAIFIGGIASGVGWVDYHHRKRHGGFRV